MTERWKVWSNAKVIKVTSSSIHHLSAVGHSQFKLGDFQFSFQYIVWSYMIYLFAILSYRSKQIRIHIEWDKVKVLYRIWIGAWDFSLSLLVGRMVNLTDSCWACCSGCCFQQQTVTEKRWIHISMGHVWGESFLKGGGPAFPQEDVRGAPANTTTEVIKVPPPRGFIQSATTHQIQEMSASNRTPWV